MSTGESKKEAGAKPPRHRRVLAPGPPLWSLTKECAHNKTLQPSRCPTSPRRVLHSRFFGANPVASALGTRAKRDPGTNSITVARLSLPCS